MQSNSYQYFKNENCKYFPCHRVENSEDFNCLFCYCPLYALKDKCGGNFVYKENGIKDCTNCTLPHDKDGYNHVMNHSKDIVNLGRKGE